MCRPDLTVWTYDWLPGDPDPMPNHAVQHECVDWGRLELWLEHHKFSVADGIIKRPDGT